MPELTEFGRLLHRAQLKSGLDETAFAAKLGISWRTLYRWKRGRTKRIHSALIKFVRQLADGNSGDRP